MQNPLLNNDRPSSKAKLWAIAIFLLFAAGLTFLLNRYSPSDQYSPPKPDQNHPLLVIHHGDDSTVIDIEGWDSLKIDSFIKADIHHRQNYDSLAKVYGVDRLDSIMNVSEAEKNKKPKP